MAVNRLHVANIDAAPVRSGDVARDALGRQVDGPVRWVESIRWVIDEAGIDTFLEVGHGKVLTGLGRRIDKAVAWKALPAPSQLEDLISELE